MKHYDYVEWVLYKKNLLNDDIRKEMEEHLYLCDECMEIFLSLIDEEEVKKAEEIIPEDFTDKIIDSIKNISPIKTNIKKKVRINNDFFIYYAAVASVTIILTAGGFFGKLVDYVPEINSSIAMKETKLQANMIYDISEQIANKTSKFINDFQFKIVKEE